MFGIMRRQRRLRVGEMRTYRTWCYIVATFALMGIYFRCFTMYHEGEGTPSRKINAKSLVKMSNTSVLCVFKEHDITWAVQLTVDRVPTLDTAMRRWNGPINLVFYSKNLTEDIEQTKHLRNRADLHFVPATESRDRPYPVNSLRNAAIQLSRTRWFLLCDADFVPSTEMYEYLLGQLPSFQASKQKSIWILPAYQIANGHEIPKTKEELLAMGPLATQVHPEKGRSIAHVYTDYEKWATATMPYKVNYKMPYEPYYVADKEVPRYSNEFSGYGNDKTGQLYEVNAAGYDFMVLPGGFLVHKNHEAAAWVRARKDDWKSIHRDATMDFFSDMLHKYSKQDAARVANAKFVPVRGTAGEDCFQACARAGGMACLPRKFDEGEACRLLKLSFGALCDKCVDSNDWYGPELPAFSLAVNTCLANGRPDDFPFSCQASNPKSERMCPCTEEDVVPRYREGWLTDEYVAQMLRIGKVDDLPKAPSKAPSKRSEKTPAA